MNHPYHDSHRDVYKDSDDEPYDNRYNRYAGETDEDPVILPAYPDRSSRYAGWLINGVSFVCGLALGFLLVTYTGGQSWGQWLG